jgi:hypothetical protein
LCEAETSRERCLGAKQIRQDKEDRGRSMRRRTSPPTPRADPEAAATPLEMSPEPTRQAVNAAKRFIDQIGVGQC